jgi:hypothetical protein
MKTLFISQLALLTILCDLEISISELDYLSDLILSVYFAVKAWMKGKMLHWISRKSKPE